MGLATLSPAVLAFAQTVRLARNQQNLQPPLRVVERLGKLFERIDPGHQRLHVDAAAVEQFNRARKRPATGANHGDLVHHQRRQRDRRLTVNRGLQDKRSARADQRAGRRETGRVPGDIDDDVERPAKRRC